MNKVSILLFIFFFFFYSCSSEKELKIAFIADFSSGKSSLGVQCRNAVQLAIDEINMEGGIHGRRVTLFPKDNKGNSQQHKFIVSDLKDDGVNIIIGPQLSQMAASLLEVVEGEDILVISPVVSSDLFSGIDDNFLRILPKTSTDGIILAGALIERGDKTAALIRSQSNEIYTDWFMKGVRDTLNENSIEIVYDYSYAEEDDLKSISEYLSELKPDALVLSATGSDVANIVQQYAKNNPLPHIYADGWSKITELTTFAGKTIEGAITVDVYNSHKDKSLEENFKKKYSEVFSIKPISFAGFSYEVVQLLKLAIEETGPDYSVDDLKIFILSIDDFDGIMGPLTFDQYGDSQRTKRLFIVKDSKYEPY